MNFLVIFGVLFSTALAVNAGVSMHNPNFCYMIFYEYVCSIYFIRRQFAFQFYNIKSLHIKLWYAGRFAGGFPSPTDLRNMLAFADSTIQQDILNSYNAGRTTLCSEDFEAIRTWTRQSNFTSENAFMPSEASVVQAQNIARRYQQAFPTLLTETYSRERFFFRHSPSERANSSIRAFATGLFGEAGAQDVVYEDVPDSPNRDFLLSPFDTCPQFNYEVGWQPAERESFFRGPEFEELREQVNRKLGLTGSNQLSVQQIVVMWKWCTFETTSAFEFTNSPTGRTAWCAPFSVAHHQLMEYSEDLRAFYIFGYGVPNQRLIENIHCGLYQDLLAHLQSNDEPRVRIFVALQQQAQAILYYLGVFRDVWPLHRHNYAQQFGRNYRTSIISPLGANLGVIRYDCGDGDYDIQFLLNERPILVPGCDPQTGVCKLDTLVRIFERFIGVDCETHFCSNN